MIRADLAQLPDYVPGKRMPGALKLSSNEVTQPPLPTAAEAMAQAAAGANRYPDMFTVDLREALAQHLGLRPEQVTVGCGSSALCQQLVQITCVPGDEVVFPWRSFEAYPIFTQVVGATAVPVPLNSEYKNDLPAMAAAVTERTKLVFVCNPNNPTGTTIGEDAFREFMAKIPSNVVVALDEAYFEYNRDPESPNAAELVAEYDNLVGLRTFSKAYGLAGVRVGYAFGNPELMKALDKVALPFGVNSVGQAGALASLEAKEQLLARTDEVAQQRELVAEQTGAVPSQANFVWFADASFGPAFAEAGVLVRSFPEGVRVTVTSQEEMERFLQVWKQLH